MYTIDNAKRIVVKLGYSQLINVRSGQLEREWFTSLVDDIAKYSEQGKEFIIVASGAIAASIAYSGQNKLKLLDKQVMSMIGNHETMTYYASEFNRVSKKIVPLFTTIEDIENRKRLNSSKLVINSIIEKGYIPIISENDLVTSAELRFGDCDRLSARVAHMLDADLLVLFSRADGLYTADPTSNKNAEFIKTVYDINSDIEKMATDSDIGTGGMSAKVAAAKIAINSYTHCVIMREGVNNPLSKLSIGFKSTWFIHSANNTKKYVIDV